MTATEPRSGATSTTSGEKRREPIERLAVADSSHATAGGANLDTALATLRAAGEQTRLRILAILAEGELTVSELCRVLGQTQPRVSRHLRLLCEAGLLDRHAEGTNAFFSPTRREPGRRLFKTVHGIVDPEDTTVAADRQRLSAIRAERADAAGRYFEEIATSWNDIRSLHVADGEVEAALLTTVGNHRIDGRPIESLLDVGTGTGRILEIFGRSIDSGLGVDLSAGMLRLARSNLTALGFDHCSVRQANVYALDIGSSRFDAAVLHHVLHFLDDPGAAITASAAALRPGGLLTVVDFAPHRLESLRSDHAHRRLGFADGEVLNWFADAGLTPDQIHHLPPSQIAADSDRLLTVSVWAAAAPNSTETDNPQQVS